MSGECEKCGDHCLECQCEKSHDFLYEMDRFLKNFHTMTKKEADDIANICRWSQEKQGAFLVAKRTFEGR